MRCWLPMKFDGSQIAKYSPLEGMRHEGEEQCGMHINCCNANGPRAFALLPKMTLNDQTKRNRSEFVQSIFGISSTQSKKQSDRFTNNDLS